MLHPWYEIIVIITNKKLSSTETENSSLVTRILSMWRHYRLSKYYSINRFSETYRSAIIVADMDDDPDDVMTWKRFSRYWPFVMGIHRLPMDSHHKGPVTRDFDIFFDVSLNKQLSKQAICWWFETPCSCDVSAMRKMYDNSIMNTTFQDDAVTYCVVSWLLRRLNMIVTTNYNPWNYILENTLASNFCKMTVISLGQQCVKNTSKTGDYLPTKSKVIICYQNRNKRVWKGNTDWYEMDVYSNEWWKQGILYESMRGNSQLIASPVTFHWVALSRTPFGCCHLNDEEVSGIINSLRPIDTYMRQ